MKKLFLLSLLSILLTQSAFAQTSSQTTYIVYFTGIGCPHCANVDPVLLKQKVRQKDVMVIEYEIYRDNVNAPLLMTYDKQFNTGLGVPMILFRDTKGGGVVGDKPILKKLDNLINDNNNNGIVLPAGSQSFDKLQLTDLPRSPKIWFKNRVAVRKDASSKESDTIKKFLIEGTEPQGCLPIQDKIVDLSDDQVRFTKACSFDGWVLMQD